MFSEICVSWELDRLKMSWPKRGVSYQAVGQGQPREDRNLLRFLWQEFQTDETFKTLKARNQEHLKEEREAVAAEAHRLEHGPWSSEEWNQWQAQQKAQYEAIKRHKKRRGRTPSWTGSPWPHWLTCMLLVTRVARLLVNREVRCQMPHVSREDKSRGSVRWV